MEQKQLDEIDESYFGEELIDDEEGVSVTQPKKKTTKKSAKKVDKKEEEEPKKEEKKVVKEKKVEEPVTNDPWKNDDASSPVSTTGGGVWKVLTGILLILLVVSIFTEGFGLADTTEEGELSMQEAEQKVLTYVNTELLQPPFSAEVEQTQDLEDLYKITLSIAGQSIDSYITKDGSLFFPQGLDLGGSQVTPSSELEGPIGEQPAVTNQPGEPMAGQATATSCERNNDCASGQLCMGGECRDRNAPMPTVSEPTTPVENATVQEVETQEPASENEPAMQPNSDAYEVALSSRKWSFTPNVIKVPAGEPVVLSILPDNTNPTFALTSYEFSIEGLGITKQITQKTTVEFTAQPGEYEFTCSSCDDWRGMHGTLVVE